MNRRTIERHTAGFKAEAVKLVLVESQGITNTAKKLGIPKQTLSTWVAKARSTQNTGGHAASSDMEAENKRLKQALARAEMERDILKKAAAYFASESLKGTRS